MMAGSDLLLIDDSLIFTMHLWKLIISNTWREWDEFKERDINLKVAKSTSDQLMLPYSMYVCETILKIKWVKQQSSAHKLVK